MTAVPADDGMFLRVPVAWVREVGLDAAAVHALITWRAERAGTWAATHTEIAEQTGIAVRTVGRALARLRDAGWLASRRVSRLDSTQAWEPLAHASTQVSPGLPEAQSRDCQIGRPVMTNLAVPSLETVETSPLTPQGEECDLFGSQVDPRQPEPASDPLAGFDAWWATYPRKVGKGAARSAWARVTRTTSAAVVAAGLERQVASLRAEHERGYCPHPSTWLNQERWADEVDNVRHLAPPVVPSPAERYDSSWEQRLPPPPKRDLYG